MLEHGGNVSAAAARYGIPLGSWLDLSTGINPQGWIVPPPPPDVWQFLPGNADGLTEAARLYYGGSAVLPVAGSQAAIQSLPRLRKQQARVAVLKPSYNEHCAAWLKHGHLVASLHDSEIDSAIEQLDVLIICNPNNPTGSRFSPDSLSRWHEHLSAIGGWLVVDEAFIDCTPDLSMIAKSHLPGLIVLRSLGKFFGLAGSRVGFVFAEENLLNQLKEELGPWTVAGPGRWAACQALKDKLWQSAAKRRLRAESNRLVRLLGDFGLAPTGGTAFFQWVVTEEAKAYHELLAERGILTRYFAEPASLRFGLPPDEVAWQRLAHALAQLEAVKPALR
jgi:cobalamin biosynthetic protein CobC